MTAAVAPVNALELLAEQHEEVASLFDDLEDAESLPSKLETFEALADALAVHTAIEERHFYPAVRAKRTEDILLEALDEHLAIKRVLADLIATPVDDETFDTKTAALRELVERHVEEEERDLFPKVELLMDEDSLMEIASEMLITQDGLVRRGDPRLALAQELGGGPENASLR